MHTRISFILYWQSSGKINMKDREVETTTVEIHEYRLLKSPLIL
jgi:hypothetical protein